MIKLAEMEQLPDVGTIVQQMAGKGAIQSAAKSVARLAAQVRTEHLKKSARYGYWKARLDDGQIVETNDEFCQITGYTREELLSMRIGDLELDEDEVSTLTQTEAGSAGVHDSYSTSYLGKHGDLLDLHKYAAFSDFNNGFFCGFVNDLALQRKWEQYNQAVLEAIPANVAVLDIAGTMLAANESWRRQGMDTTDLLLVVEPGMNFLTVCNKLMHTGSHSAGIIYKGILAVIEGSADHFVYEYSCHSSTGLRWFSLHAGLIVDHNKKIMLNHSDVTQKIQNEEMLNKLSLAVEHSPAAIVIADHQARIQYINPKFTEITGYTMDEVLGENPWIFQSDLTPTAAHLDMWEKIGQGKAWHGEVINKRKNGENFWDELHISPALNAEGQVTSYVGVHVDISGRKAAELELRKLFQAVEQNPESIVITNRDAEIEYVNQAFLDKTGYSREEVLGTNPGNMRSGRTPKEHYAAMWQALLQGHTWKGEFSNLRKDGTEYTDLATVSPIRQADGEISHYVSVQENITARKKGEARIHELAYFDQLTGLPNRILMEDRLNQVLAISARKQEYGAVLFIDLDRFKNINDTLGHPMGDRMLKYVAAGLLGCVRACDTVARFGGDEFIVLLPELSADEQSAASGASITAQKILFALDRSYQLGETIMHSSASIGVTLFQGDSVNAAQLLKQADLAMYHSKEDGRNLVRFFDPSLEVEMKQRAVMEDDMRTAVEQQQFILHYQAQYNHEGDLTGAEVLVRWRHPECGLISPAVFIPFAEENGFILPIGEWVLETACRKLKEWEARSDLPQIRLAVNVSAVQFKQRDFVDVVQRVLERTGANPSMLKLELTESMLIDNVEEIIGKMLVLKQMGISFALDDFGTGFSSLSFLSRLPLDQLKIDQSFVKHVLSDANDAVIAKTIITLARSLGMGVIAEGVETDTQREFLLDAGCNEYQGYLFSRPVAEQDFLQLMQFEVRSRPASLTL